MTIFLSGGTPGDEEHGLSTLCEQLDVARSGGARIALCHGVFDLLHPGHLRHLSRAKALADVLVVSITADRFVNKGPGRPAFSESLRAEALTAIAAVDHVVITAHPTALPVIDLVRPDFYVKGSDYADEEADATGNIRRERELVESFGGRLEHTDEIVFSSSALINRHLPQHSDEATQWLDDFRKRHSIEEVIDWLTRASELRVVVVGETILDTYTSCDALGKASKDPVLCFSRGESTSHAGGILAIAGHCSGIGTRTSVVTGLNSATVDDPAIAALRSRGVALHHVATDPRPTIRKERLIDERTGARVLELYDMDDSPLSAELDRELVARFINASSEADVVIVADYGHGLISDDLVAAVTHTPAFLAVNTQTNAGNRGFNSISRYPRADLVTLNGLEAQLEVRRRHVDLAQFIPALLERLGASGVLVTRGGGGLDLYGGGGSITQGPALAPFVKDRVGAGDALLSVVALLAAIGAPADITVLLANLVGAWAVSFLGNEQTLDFGTLTRQINSILK